MRCTGRGKRKDNVIYVTYSSELGLGYSKEKYLELVSKNGLLLQYCGPYRRDFDVIMAALKQNRLAIQFAIFEELSGTQISDICLCIKESYEQRVSLNFEPKEEDLIKYPSLARCVKYKKFFKDAEFINLFLMLNGANMEYCPAFVQSSYDFANTALDSNALAYNFLAHDLQSNPTVISKTYTRAEKQLASIYKENGRFISRTDRIMLGIEDLKKLIKDLRKHIVDIPEKRGKVFNIVK